MQTKSLSSEILQEMEAYWRITGYLSFGQNFLNDISFLGLIIKIGNPTASAPIDHKLYIDKHGQDILKILNWKWGGS